MAAPNIINVTSVIPHTVSISPADVARNSLVTAPSTNQAHKINTIIVANVDESTAYNCTVELLLTDGTTYRPIANTVTVTFTNFHFFFLTFKAFLIFSKL